MIPAPDLPDAACATHGDPVAHVQLVGNGDTPTLFDHL